MPERVVLAHPDQRDAGARRSRQSRIELRRSVVGHLRHVHVDRPRPQNRLLRLRFDVAEEGRARVWCGQQQTHAGVVGHRSGMDDTLRPDHSEPHVPHQRHGCGRRHADRHPAEQSLCLFVLLDRLPPRADPDLCHRSGEHAAEPIDVVGVEVAENEQIHPIDPEPVQAGVGRLGIGAGVHNNHAPTGSGDKGIPLSDVARDDPPVPRRPAIGEGDRRTHQRHEPGRHHDHVTTADREHPDGHDARQQDARVPRKPGQLGYPVPGRHAQDQLAEGPSQHGGHTPGSDSPLPGQRDESQHRHHRCQGSGEHIGDDRARPHCTTYGEQDRECRDLGSHRGGKSSPIDHGDQARSRSDGQHEAHRVGQPRVQHQQEHSADLQDMGRGASPTDQPGGESQSGHHRCSQDARLRSDDHHERSEYHARRQCTWRARDVQPPSQPVHQGEQDRAVRARHRREVGQARRPHVICGDRRESLITAESHPGQKPTRVPVPRHLPHQHTRGGRRPVRRNNLCGADDT